MAVRVRAYQAGSNSTAILAPFRFHSDQRKNGMNCTLPSCGYTTFPPAGMTDSTIPFFSFQYPFAEEAHCTVSPTLKFSILLRLFRPFIADCQSASLPTIERTAGTCKVRCTVVALFLDALDMLAIRTILCRRMFLPVYAIFCDSWHIIPRDSYARPTVWGMKSPAGGGRGVGCFCNFDKS